MAPGPDGGDSSTLTAEQRAYVAGLASRIRIGNAGALLRTGGIQALWVVVILAGAGVPLTEALGGPSWLGPSLGFAVVVAAGVERIFGRATPAAAAQDLLRRGLARERRLFLAGAGPYASGEAGFDLYAERSERLVADYDSAMVEYSTTLARRAE